VWDVSGQALFKDEINGDDFEPLINVCMDVDDVFLIAFNAIKVVC
jgi:hypothetical protein